MTFLLSCNSNIHLLSFMSNSFHSEKYSDSLHRITLFHSMGCQVIVLPTTQWSLKRINLNDSIMQCGILRIEVLQHRTHPCNDKSVSDFVPEVGFHIIRFTVANKDFQKLF